jgi:hypothetical protein
VKIVQLKSQNGWPASKIRAEIGIESFPVPGTKIKLACAKAVAPLLVGFAAEFHELIEPIDEGGLDDWGYCFRMVRGSEDRLSNHSSGTALDLNATRHTLGKVGTFPAEKVPMIKALAKKYSLIWGGSDNWRRKDEMHFEVAIPPSKVEAAIAKIGATK